MKINEMLVLLFILGLLGLLFGFLVGKAIDTSFDNRDRMLCESAQVSGNEVYLEKCVCYYAGENIRCIYKGEHVAHNE